MRKKTKDLQQTQGHLMANFKQYILLTILSLSLSLAHCKYTYLVTLSVYCLRRKSSFFFSFSLYSSHCLDTLFTCYYYYYYCCCCSYCLQLIVSQRSFRHFIHVCICLTATATATATPAAVAISSRTSRSTSKE